MTSYPGLLGPPPGAGTSEEVVFLVVRGSTIVARVAATVLVAAILVTLWRTPGWGRSLAGFVGGAMAIAMVAVSLGYLGASSLVFSGLVAYGLLRHRMLDVDVKLRYGISKSSLAAAFVATFFVASEGAQLVFGAGNEWVGLTAAGGLVFALAPLQRAAERLAERAVPPVAPGIEPTPAAVAASGGPESDREAMFRDAVRLALRDRRLTRDEELQLFRLAPGLGLAPDRAHKVLAEVDREAGVAT